jgi:hypothetical protein
MFLDLKDLLTPGSTPQQACQRVQAAAAAAAAGSGYAHPMAGSCPLTGGALLLLLPLPQ